ncbi:MAG: isoprenylcysteine carboxylmethyltransferase family protein [Flavobacteriaceae bacterium]|nr:isoprenylcysteine carboxylmethyltransferase family protein [Flavobacteriaceae bacterium]
MKKKSKVKNIDNAGVHFPPPLIHLIAVGVGIFLNVLYPLDIYIETTFLWLGYGLIVVSLIVAGLCFREFKVASTSIKPDQSTTTIVRKGPYRFSRNPMYVCMVLLHFGVALWMNSVWVLLSIVPALLIITIYVIPREERYLEGKFGQTYLEYKNSVRRWF